MVRTCAYLALLVFGFGLSAAWAGDSQPQPKAPKPLVGVQITPVTNPPGPPRANDLRVGVRGANAGVPAGMPVQNGNTIGSSRGPWLIDSIGPWNSYGSLGPVVLVMDANGLRPGLPGLTPIPSPGVFGPDTVDGANNGFVGGGMIIGVRQPGQGNGQVLSLPIGLPSADVTGVPGATVTSNGRIDQQVINVPSPYPGAPQVAQPNPVVDRDPNRTLRQQQPSSPKVSPQVQQQMQKLQQQTTQYLQQQQLQKERETLDQYRNVQTPEVQQQRQQLQQYQQQQQQQIQQQPAIQNQQQMLQEYQQIQQPIPPRR